MNTPLRNPLPRSRSASAKRSFRRLAAPRLHPSRGVALLLVLSALVLLSVLVIGVLGSARQEVATSANFSAGNEARLVSDTAINIVTAQIAKATSDEDLAWISQPGLIRTFSPGGQQDAYKLYSSYTMVEGASFSPQNATTTEVPTDWYTKPNEFVDLNRPVVLQDRLVYPIADPAAADLVEGFDPDAAGAWNPGGNSPLANELPMPVRWIYITPAGQMVGADHADRPKATARVAFWADDETSKVNINTAAGGVHYDYPAVHTREDHFLARAQPIAQEYQRWPGHPSTTSLAPVISALRSIEDPVERSRESSLVTPRIGWGGSEGGTKYAWLERNLGVTDMDRLYASVDELSYGQTMANSERVPLQLSNGTSLESGDQSIDKLRFFLTAQSRAPELNLFNRPRVTLWPFNHEMVKTNAAPADVEKLTPEDNLIRFASELGGVRSNGTLNYSARQRFYFQRQSAWDPNVDVAIPDNVLLFDYLKRMTELRLPSATPERTGIGNTLVGKYGADDRDQILLSMWDYIRSNINTVNQAYQPVGRQPYSFPVNHTTEQSGYNDVTPLKLGDKKGFGRAPVLSEVTLQFYNVGEEWEPDSSNPIGYVDEHDNANPQSQVRDQIPDYVIRKVKMVLLLNFHAPVNSLMKNLPRFQVKISGQPLNFLTDDMMINSGQTDAAALPVLVRNPTALATTWATALNDQGIGFPGIGNKDTLYLSGYRNGTRAGEFGIDFPMYAPLKLNAKQGNKSNWPATHQFKIFKNREPLSTVENARIADFEGGSSRGDIYYPFVSDVIEFKLPQSHLEPNKVKAGNHKKVTNANGQVSMPRWDYFEVRLAAGTMDIEIYPGLKDGATDLWPKSNWADQTNSNLLMKTTIRMVDEAIPLPRLGPRVASNGQEYKVASQPYTYEDLRDYDKRSFWGTDHWMLCPPQKLGSDSPIAGLDVFRSYSITSRSPVYGDLRLAAIRQEIPSDWWEPYALNVPGSFHGTSNFPGYMKAVGNSGDPREITDVDPGTGTTNQPWTARGRMASLHRGVPFTGDLGTHRTAAPMTTATTRDGSQDVGDFSLGFGSSPAGALVVGPDVGSVAYGGNFSAVGSTSPYFGGDVSRAGSDDSATDVDSGAAWNKNLTGFIFSPFKQAPSPVIFGTIPSRTSGTLPGSWETLLFSPNPAGRRTTHRGWDGPRDHYFLDLFYSPVVEPYAITENFATAGKVNLNYQIAPFTYISRKSSMHALLDGMTERGAWRHQAGGATAGAPPTSSTLPTSRGSIMAISVADATAEPGAIRTSNLKISDARERSLRTFVGIETTLQAFDQRFAANDPFVSASEITEMFLLPEGASESFWNDKGMTGDDKLESPYNAIYPRVTTRSNTFRVHFWAQTLNPKGSATTPRVTGEYRGSTVVERYLDPNIEEYASDFPALNDKYLFRKVDHHQFAP